MIVLPIAVVFAGVVSVPEQAHAVAMNTWYKNAKGTQNILVKISPTSRYINTIRPGKSIVLYGSNKVGWVPSNCELQRYSAGRWRIIGDAYHRSGYWIKLPSYLTSVQLGTWCYH